MTKERARHKGTIVRIYVDEGGSVLTDMLKQGAGTSLFTFELSSTHAARDTVLRLLEMALVHGLPTVITETDREILHVQVARFV